MNIKTKLYLFYITFFAIIAIFPITTDYIIQTYLLIDIPLFTPFPDEFTKIFLILGGALILSFIVIKYTIRTNKIEKLEYVSISIFRYSLAFIMIFIYGYSKIAYKQFELSYGAMDTLLRNVSDKDLTWYFFGRSNIQTLLFGLFEFIPCILLLFKRTTFLGATLLFPVLSEVILVNIFNNIEYHTLVFGILFLFLDVGILLFYRKEISNLFITTRQKIKTAYTGRKIKMLFTIAKIIFIFLFVARYTNRLYLATQINTGKMFAPSKCLGAYKLQEMTCNDTIINLDNLSNYWNKIYFEKFGQNNILRDKMGNTIKMNYIFSDDQDSIEIITYNKIDIDGYPIDTIDIFKGTYLLSNKESILTLNGVKNKTSLKAVYKKLPINGRDWWW